MTLQQLKEEAIGAVARGWTYYQNKDKEFDAELAEAIVQEVDSLITKAYEEGKSQREKEIQDVFIDCFGYDFNEKEMLEGWEKYHTKINNKKAIMHHCYECCNGENALNFYNILTKNND